MLMTIDRMTKMKTTMINKTKILIWILTSYVETMDISQLALDSCVSELFLVKTMKDFNILCGGHNISQYA